MSTYLAYAYEQAPRKGENREKRGCSDADSDDSVEGDHVGDDSSDELLKTTQSGAFISAYPGLMA